MRAGKRGNESRVAPLRPGSLTTDSSILLTGHPFDEVRRFRKPWVHGCVLHHHSFTFALTKWRKNEIDPLFLVLQVGRFLFVFFASSSWGTTALLFTSFWRIECYFTDDPQVVFYIGRPPLR